MIPTYDVNNLTGNLDTMFQNMMKIGFVISIVLLTIWIIVSLLIWLFRSQKEIWKSNKIWNKEFIKVSENQKNIDIDNKFIKPIVDGLVLSKVIADDNINNMFYGVLGTTNKTKKPFTEVSIFKGESLLKWIENRGKMDMSNVSTWDKF